MKFFIEMTPPKATAQQQKTAVIGGRIRKYDPKNLKQAKGELMLMLREFRPETPIDGALRVQIEWRYPFQKGHLTKSGNLKKGLFEALPCQTRPDVDNLQKALFDAMTKLGFWRDDSQIASVTFEKGFSRMPGIYVEIINCDYVFGALESSNF